MSRERPRAWPGLTGRPLVIYLVSPQPWDGFKVSKHHYAAELAELGHRVYFIEPPVAQRELRTIQIAATEFAGVLCVTNSTWFPYNVKFHARSLFDIGMRGQASKIVRAIGMRPDIVWDFDNAFQFADLSWFDETAFRIFHPVDDIAENSTDKNADAVLAIAQRFRDRIANSFATTIVVPHGLGRLHESLARDVVANPERPLRRERLVIGYVGNLEHSGIDWPNIVAAIEENPGSEFVFVGPYDANSQRVPVERLRAFEHVTLAGAKTTSEVVSLARSIDVWLICYDPRLSIDGATNSHKILEYLASGSPVVSNRITAYEGSDLVIMMDDDNRALPGLLGSVLLDLAVHDHSSLRRRRAEFALGHTYGHHIAMIDAELSARASGQGKGTQGRLSKG